METESQTRLDPKSALAKEKAKIELALEYDEKY